MKTELRAAPALLTAALHVAALVALLQLEVVRRPLADAIPLMVDILAPPPPVPPPVVEPARPLPMAKTVQPRRPPEPAPLVATQSAAATGIVAPAAVPAPPEPAPPAPVAAAPPPIVPPAFHAAYLRNPPPAYPAMSRRRGEEGTVMLRVFVAADGSAQKVLVHASSGHERLDQAAHDAVHQWRFVPARQGEQAVAAWVLVPVRFALEK